jgi:hypothetical protein
MKQTELDDKEEAKNVKLAKALEPVERLFARSGPVETPVLWRLLLAHAMYLHIFADLVDNETAAVSRVLPPNIDLFTWQPADAASFTKERDAACLFVQHRLEEVGVAPRGAL